MNFFKTKPNMLQQDFHRGNNPAYDRVAFVAEHYEELVFMYKDILEHLKQGGTGGGTGTGTGGCGCTRITKQVESPYGFVQLDKESFKLMGYDLDNPDDMQFFLHNTYVGADNYTSLASSEGIEYYDTYEVDIGSKDILFSRDSDLNDFLDNPSKLQDTYRVTISYYNQDNQEITEEFYRYGDSGNSEAFANRESLLQGLYLKLSRDCKYAIQNKPITVRLKNSEYIQGSGYEVLYEKTSDSVENNALYVGKTPEEIVTFNNVLLFPRPTAQSGYASRFYFRVNYLTTPWMRDYVSILGQGDIIKCTKYKNEIISLSADLPEIRYEHTDLHTFTYTIDPVIKDNC